MKTVRIVLCSNKSQVAFYFNEMLERMKLQKRDFTVKSKTEIIEGEDRYIFLTPDEPNKLQGLKIQGWDEVGDVYKHPKYDECLELLESRMQ